MSSRELGTPISQDLIPLASPEIKGNEWKYIKECLDSGWISSVGPFVDRFEGEIAAYVGAKYAVATINGTAALHIALQVIGLRPGEEVIVSNLTFIAPVNAIRYNGAHPIFVDAHPETWQIDPDKIERFLSEESERRDDGCFNRKTGRRIRVILPVHILGLACENHRIVNLAKQYGLNIVEDAAEALGVRYHGQHVGTFGDIGVLSFNGNKIITTGGGGMIVTNNEQWAARARYLTTQAKDDRVESIHNEVGYNYRLSNVQAALGVAQLEQIDEFIGKKQVIARAYERGLRDLDRVTLMPTPRGVQATYWLYSILLDEKATMGERKKLIKYLNDNGISARSFWHTIHDLRPYHRCQAVEIEHSVRLYERGVSLPCSVGLSTQDQRKCIQVLRQNLVK